MTSLMHRSGSLEDAEKLESTSGRNSIFTKASVIRLVVASVLTVCVIGGVLINSGTRQSPPTTDRATPSSATPIPTPGPASAPAPASESPKPFATDVRGFLDAGARCAPTQSAVATGRTEKSLVVICKGGNGRLEYKGVRLSLGTGVSIGDVTANADGFVARNEVMTYVVTPTELVIRSADAVVAREPMVEYGSPLAVRGPAPPVAVAAPPAPAVPVAAPPAPAVPVAQPSPAPQAPPPPQSSNPPVAGYPPLPMTARGTGNGIVRFTASRPWQLRYLVNCPANTAARGSIDAGASYMRYHVELRGDPNAPAAGTSPSREQSGPILVSIELADQRCGWEVSA